MGSFSPLSAFADLAPPPHDEQIALTQVHDTDPNEQKVNLSTEEYKDRNGEPWVLPVVRQVSIATYLRPIYQRVHRPNLN